MSAGFRVYLRRPILFDDSLSEAYAALATAPVADAMHRMCAMNSEVRLFSGATKTMAGRALTVHVCNGDSLLIHKALDMAGKGDVLVVSTSDRQRSLMGEIMFRMAMHKQLAGVVVDGCIRDLAAVRTLPLPVFAVAGTPGGPYHHGPGEINVPVACGDISVSPGDLVMGDADGVVVIPAAEAANFYEKARASFEKDERRTREACENIFHHDWVDAELTAKGGEQIDACWNDAPTNPQGRP